MRNIIAITQVSVDGVMQGPGGPEEDPSGGFTQGGWAMHFADEASGKVIRDIMASKFDLLLGRRTYDIWIGYWPKQDDFIAKPFNKVTKYVVTHRAEGLDWETSVQLSDVEELRRVKALDGPDLHIWGSSKLLQTLIAADLVDEYRLWIFPVVLGKGKRLFEDGVPPRELKLVETVRTPRGVVFNTYRPVGPAKTKKG